MMDESRFCANVFSEVCQEGNYVMFEITLDLMDSLNFERSAFGKRLGNATWNGA
jgi:hypothetical protein